MSNYRTPFRSASDKLIELIQTNRQIINFLLGSTILVYGSRFPATTIVVASLRIHPIPQLEKNLIFLIESAYKALLALQSKTPEFLSIIRRLNNLRLKYQELQRHTDSRTMLEREEVINEINQLESLVAEMNASVSDIASTVEAKRVREVLGSVYNSIMSCIAVSSSHVAKIWSLGYGIGQVIGDRIEKVILAQRRRLTHSINSISSGDSESDPLTSSDVEFMILDRMQRQNWLTPVAKFFGNCVGLFIAYTLQSAALTYNACVVGSELVVSSIEDLVDPFLSSPDLAQFRLRSNPELVTLLQFSLVSVGLGNWILSNRPFQSPTLIGSFIDTFLYPLILTERALSALLLFSARRTIN